MQCLVTWSSHRYFYPRPPRGGRLSAERTSVTSIPISIHALREEGDAAGTDGAQDQKHFYPRPPRGGRHHIQDAPAVSQQISIHALREEGDLLPCSIPFHINLFLSTPSARRATSGAVTIAAVDGFLSTPSARRATRGAAGRGASSPDFYPRPPRGGRLVLLAVRIQIVQFLSTPSARRATTALVWRRQ